MDCLSLSVAIVNDVAYVQQSAVHSHNAEDTREHTFVVDKLTEVVVVPERLEGGLGCAQVVGADRLPQVLRRFLAVVPGHAGKEVVNDVEVRH